MARNIYKPDLFNLTPEQEMILNKKFALGLSRLKDNSEVSSLLLQIKKYNASLKNLNLKDYEVYYSAPINFKQPKFNLDFNLKKKDIQRFLLLCEVSLSICPEWSFCNHYFFVLVSLKITRLYLECFSLVLLLIFYKF